MRTRDGKDSNVTSNPKVVDVLRVVNVGLPCVSFPDNNVVPDVVPRPSPLPVAPARSHLVPSTASCVAMNLGGISNTATHGARRHLFIGAASCVDPKIAGNTTSATHGACPPASSGASARHFPSGIGVDVVAKPDPKTDSATPTPLPSSRPLVSPPPGGVGVSPKPDATTMTETSTPPAASSPIVLDTMGPPRILTSGSSPPAHRPPPPPFWDEAFAQARNQSATAARRAGSLASRLRGSVGVRSGGRLADHGTRNIPRAEGWNQRPKSAVVHNEASVPVHFESDAPAEMPVAAATAAGRAAARAVDGAPPATPSGLG